MFKPQAVIALLAVAGLTTVVSAGKPKPQASKKSPLLLEARLAERVVIYDANNPLSNTLDLAFFVENVSPQPLDVFDLTVILTFHDGETQTIDFEAPGVLEPTFGSVFFPLLVLPEDAATGGAAALVIARYEDAAAMSAPGKSSCGLQW